MVALLRGGFSFVNCSNDYTISVKEIQILTDFCQLITIAQWVDVSQVSAEIVSSLNILILQVYSWPILALELKPNESNHNLFIQFCIVTFASQCPVWSWVSISNGCIYK